MKKIGKSIMIFFVILVVLLALLAYYSFYIEPNRLVIHNYELGQVAKTDTKEMKIVQLSDLHLSEYFDLENLDNLVAKVNAQSPDLILFTGDLFDVYNVYPKSQEVSERLQQLKSNYGKYAIWGNRDYGGGAVRVYEDVMQNAGFTILRNESKMISINDRNILLQGLDDALMGAPEPELLKTQESLDYRILLAHEPDIVDEFREEEVDLFLSGHSHGGQIRLPFQDVIHTSMAQKYKRGFYTVNPELGSKIYVNTGLGTTKIHARLGVPPEIVIFHLK